MDGSQTSLFPNMNGMRPTFQSAISDPAMRALQSSRSSIKAKAPNFFQDNLQLMIISILGITFYTLCIVRVTKNKEIPIALGAITTLFVLILVQRYHSKIPTQDTAWIGWIFAMFLVSAIGSMAYWIDQDKKTM